MIQKTELRINNEVYYDDKTICTVVGINFGETVELAGCEGFISITDIDPIPLTPDILVKCGFKHGMVEGITRLRDVDDTYEEEGDTHFWDLRVPTNDKVEGLSTFNLVKFGSDDITFSSNWLRVKLFYLHQLQNLFFSLCGKELEINL